MGIAKVWDGSQWVVALLKTYTGSAWTDGRTHFWDGDNQITLYGGDNLGSNWPAPNAFTLTTTWTDAGSDLDGLLDVMATRKWHSFGWSGDGVHVIYGNSSDDNRYTATCSTPWDPSTATPSGSVFLKATAPGQNPHNLHFILGGLTFCEVSSNDTYRTYTLATPYLMLADPTPVSSDASEFELFGASDTSDPEFSILEDGSYAVGFHEISNLNRLSIIPLGVALLDTIGARITYDIETNLGYSSNPNSGASSILLSPDGTTVYHLTGTKPATVSRFVMSTPFDPTTATWDSGEDLTVGLVDGATNMSISADGQTLMFSDLGLGADCLIMRFDA